MHQYLPKTLLLTALFLALTACSPTPTEVPASTDQGISTPTASAEPVMAQPTTGAASTEASQAPVVQSTQPVTCTATPPDALGPFYVPGAPERSKVGEGYLLTGVVRSASGCAPLPQAQIEIWMAGPDGEYGDDFRATLFTDENGAYSFESHFPPPYSGRPSHHHFRVSLAGYETLVTQHYPKAGETQAAFDLVLLPTP